MSRRIYSGTGIYHVMVRGNNKSDIFHSDRDRRVFISYMKKYSCDNFKIYTFGLMPNHVHILLWSDQLSQVMQKMLLSYTLWYNTKYQKTGHLFQGRFKSQAIEDELYLARCVRYILLNPIKANLTKEMDYRWSSYRCYFSEEETFVDVKLVNDLFKSKEEFDYYLGFPSESDDEFEDIKSGVNELREMLLGKYPEISSIKSDTIINRNKLINRVREENPNISVVMLGKIFNLSRAIREIAKY